MLGFVSGSPQAERYGQLADRISETMNFMRAIGINSESHPSLRETDFFTSHEALLLGYEEALTRVDSTSGEWYATSGHMIWIGDRTRQPDNAHVEYCRGIKNPIGLKCGPSLSSDELLRLIDILNPQNEAGRLTLITRFGPRQGRRTPTSPYPRRAEGRPQGRVVVRSDARQHDHRERLQDPALRPYPFGGRRLLRRSPRRRHARGGIHIEMTGKDVTECTGGARPVLAEDLSDRYHTHCDPRLNANQALELAFLTAERIKKEQESYRLRRPSASEPIGIQIGTSERPDGIIRPFSSGGHSGAET